MENIEDIGRVLTFVSDEDVRLLIAMLRRFDKRTIIKLLEIEYECRIGDRNV